MEQQPYKTDSCTTETCGTGKKVCWFQRLLIAAIAAFVMSMVYDCFVHGSLLADAYKASASLWRTDEEMKALFPLCLGSHFVEALLFSMLFIHWRKHQTFGAYCTPQCPVRRGFIFGIKVGALLGVSQASSFIYSPIPQDIAISWLIATTLKWALIGAVLAWMSKCYDKNKATPEKANE